MQFRPTAHLQHKQLEYSNYKHQHDINSTQLGGCTVNRTFIELQLVLELYIIIITISSSSSSSSSSSWMRTNELRWQAITLTDMLTPRHCVTVSRWHDVTVSRCHSVTMTQCHDDTASRWHSVTMTRCHSVTMSQYHNDTVSSCDNDTMTQCHDDTVSQWHSVIVTWRVSCKSTEVRHPINTQHATCLWPTWINGSFYNTHHTNYKT